MRRDEKLRVVLKLQRAETRLQDMRLDMGHNHLLYSKVGRVLEDVTATLYRMRQEVGLPETWA